MCPDSRRDMEKRYKLVVYVPETHTEIVRDAMGDAGAGVIGNYTHCMFTVAGTGQFKPGPGADPTIGEIGKLEHVAEDRIETVCTADRLRPVLAAVRKVHPYEEPAIDVYPIELVT
ncbi:N/A [soil metagenome]